MNEVLTAWNGKDPEDAIGEMLACCRSHSWASGMVGRRPHGDEEELRAAADAVWWSLSELDWLEAYAAHPRIGERVGPESSVGTFQKWSGQEQALVANAEERIRDEIARGNEEYESRFGFTYIVCATGKSAEEMLDILRHRLGNGRASEIREAAKQQMQITQIRLRKWLVSY